MKICRICKIKKEKTEFHKRNRSKDGLSDVCKSCKKQKDKEYREANKEKLKRKAMEYMTKNKEVIAKRRKERYHNATPEEVENRKRKKREYAKNAPEKVKQRKKEYDKKYFASEAGKITTAKSVHKRRAQKIATEDGTVTSQSLEKLKEEQQYRCKYCKCDLDFSAKGQVHLDHVIPLSKGGCHSISNVVWSCASCNLKKSDKVIYE